MASSLVADHRSAIGCNGQTPNNATATRTTVTACAAAAAIASLGGIHLRRRSVAIAAAVISIAFVVGLAAYMATDSPPLSTGLVIIGSLLGIVRTVRPAPS